MVGNRSDNLPLAERDRNGLPCGSRPRVSLIMPGYNGMPYLPFALDSILAQSMPDFELIFVDDASTDQTVEVVADYAARDNRIRLLINQQNSGIAVTLNVGLGAARGELIAIMDDDDISLPERFQRQVDFLEAHSDHVLVGTYYEMIDVNGRVQKTIKSPIESWELEWFAHFWNPVGHPTAMFRASVVRERDLLYNTNHRTATDVDFLVRLLEHGKASNLPIPLVRYRMHPRNVSTVFSEEQNREVCEIRLRNLIKWYPNVLEEEAVKDLFHLLIYRQRLRHHLASQFAVAMRSIELSFLHGRHLSPRQERRIHALGARWLAWAVAGAGSTRDVLGLLWHARPYQLLFLRLGVEFLCVRAMEYARREMSRVRRHWSGNSFRIGRRM